MSDSPTDPTAVRTRFAPSPTGYLHVGGARTALFNWLFARHHGGQFVLRVEDTDEARNTDEARTAILDGLRWLGIDWDEGPEVGGDFGPYFQSQRTEIYDKHFARLQEAGAIYEDGGAWRFRFPEETVTIRDQVCGDVDFDASAEPDMTIRRPDGSYIFHFVNVVDDLEMGITHVIRGEDHLANTWKHLLLFRALEAVPPVYAHIPLLLNPDGSKMSKRDDGASIQSYIDGGFLPEGVLNYLCLLGWSPKDDTEKLPIKEVIARFGLDAINSSNAGFDLEKCRWFSGQYLGSLPPRTFADRADAALDHSLPLYDKDYAADLLPLYQTKVRTFGEVAELSDYMFTDDYKSDQKAVDRLHGTEGIRGILGGLKAALSAVADWEPDNIGAAIGTAAEGLGVKKGALMFPARVTTSGRGGGPDLLPMLELLGKERVLNRIEKSLEAIEALHSA